MLRIWAFISFRLYSNVHKKDTKEMTKAAIDVRAVASIFASDKKNSRWPFEQDRLVHHTRVYWHLSQDSQIANQLVLNRIIKQVTIQDR